MNMNANTFQIGQTIRSHDFFMKQDSWVQGEIVAVHQGEADSPVPFYAWEIVVERAAWEDCEDGDRIGETVYVPVMTSLEWTGRVMEIIDITPPINDLSDIPWAACPRCGGWTDYGGMSQHANAEEPVLRRTGCTCHHTPRMAYYNDLDLDSIPTRDVVRFRQVLSEMLDTLPNGDAGLRAQLDRIENALLKGATL